MVHLVADETPLRILADLIEPAVICSSKGKVIGRFTPFETDVWGVFDRPLLTPEEIQELDRRSAPDQKRFTTQQVFEHLLSLTSEPDLQVELRELIQRLAERDACPTP